MKIHETQCSHCATNLIIACDKEKTELGYCHPTEHDFALYPDKLLAVYCTRCGMSKRLTE